MECDFKLKHQFDLMNLWSYFHTVATRMHPKKSMGILNRFSDKFLEKSMWLPKAKQITFCSMT